MIDSKLQRGCCEQVLFDLTPREMEIFDGDLQSLPICCVLPRMPNCCSNQSSVIALSCPPEFEGDEYYKAEVRPMLEDGGALDTSIYVWQESARYATRMITHLTPSRARLASTVVSKALLEPMSMAVTVSQQFLHAFMTIHIMAWQKPRS